MLQAVKSQEDPGEGPRRCVEKKIPIRNQYTEVDAKTVLKFDIETGSGCKKSALYTQSWPNEFQARSSREGSFDGYGGEGTRRRSHCSS